MRSIKCDYCNTRFDAVEGESGDCPHCKARLSWHSLTLFTSTEWEPIFSKTDNSFPKNGKSWEAPDGFNVKEVKERFTNYPLDEIKLEPLYASANFPEECCFIGDYFHLYVKDKDGPTKKTIPLPADFWRGYTTFKVQDMRPFFDKQSFIQDWASAALGKSIPKLDRYGRYLREGEHLLVHDNA